MRKWFWIGLAVVVVVIGVVVYLTRSNPTLVGPLPERTRTLTPSASSTVTATSEASGAGTTSPTDTAAAEQTVTIDNTGFSPTTISVALGTTVIFKNTDTAEHRVASDPHPQNSSLPALDSTIKPGETFSFVFERAGSWGAHDHLFPTHTMTIIVK